MQGRGDHWLLRLCIVFLLGRTLGCLDVGDVVIIGALLSFVRRALDGLASSFLPFSPLLVLCTKKVRAVSLVSGGLYWYLSYFHGIHLGYQ